MGSKYRYMEVNLQQRRKALSAKIPDIEQTLGVVNFLAARKAKAEGKTEEDEVGSDLGSDDIDALLDGEEDDEHKDKDKPLTTLFELNDTLYAEAQVQETGEVGLWLGVSLEFEVDVWCGVLERDTEAWDAMRRTRPPSSPYLASDPHTSLLISLTHLTCCC